MSRRLAVEITIRGVLPLRTIVWRAIALLVVGLSLAAVVPAALAREPSALPPAQDEISLEPTSGTNYLGEQGTFTAVLNEESEDCCGVEVTFTVLDGPNAGVTSTVTSGDDGRASFTYTSSAVGIDDIQASFFDSSSGEVDGSNIVQEIWKPAAVGLQVASRPVALVEVPGTSSFVGAQPTQDLPKGTVVDIGGNRAVTIQNYFGQRMTFLGVPDRVPSRFKLVSGVRSRLGTIEMKLAGGNFARCRNARTLSVAGTAAAPSKDKPIRRLWGTGKGHYQTSGKYASATVRGTFWEIADYCNGTLVHVRLGSVLVHDFATRHNVIVTSGHSYFAQKR